MSASEGPDRRPMSIQAPYRLVITPGREHTFRWPSNFWETGLDNPDTNLVNPTDYRLPPTVSTQELVANAATTRRPSTDRINVDESSDEDYQRSRDLPTPPLLRRNPLLRIFAPPIAPLASRISAAATSDSDSHRASTPTAIVEAKFPACWCSTDVCLCTHRPDTPPTPPGITLWSPSDTHLPDNRI